MDPIANLERQRALAGVILNDDNESTDAQDLAELVQSLDEWKQRGGFDPWQPGGPWVSLADYPYDALLAELERRQTTPLGAALADLRRRFQWIEAPKP